MVPIGAGLSQLEQNSCSQMGPTLKGPSARVIYSLLFKYTQDTMQVLQRTASGPAPPKAVPDAYP